MTSLPARKPRILWASVNCILDTTSGASMSIREMLLQLVSRGYEVSVLGATAFDHPRGIVKLREYWDAIQAKKDQVVNIHDGPLTHRLVVTKSTDRLQITAEEENVWWSFYCDALDKFKPDLVYYYGGYTLDFLVAAEARDRNIPVVAYLANGKYKGNRWCRDVDLVITNSQANVDMYYQKEGIRAISVGSFVNPFFAISPVHARERLLFVNPLVEKGAGIVIQLAVILEKKRPDIIFEVVESRDNWNDLVKRITHMIGNPKESLSNVVVTPNTDDMRPIYSRARMLLAPSLWWESAGRVLAEAMVNGIPAVITDRGGMAEMVQNAAIRLHLPPECYEQPYNKLPKLNALDSLIDLLIRVYDDSDFYDNLVAKAHLVGQSVHRLESKTQRLINAITPLLEKKAGDQNPKVILKQIHRQGIS